MFFARPGWGTVTGDLQCQNGGRKEDLCALLGFSVEVKLVTARRFVSARTRLGVFFFFLSILGFVFVPNEDFLFFIGRRRPETVSKEVGCFVFLFLSIIFLQILIMTEACLRVCWNKRMQFFHLSYRLDRTACDGEVAGCRTSFL